MSGDLVVSDAIPCIIGEKVRVTATDGDGAALEDVTWTIQGRIVSGYDEDTGTVTDVDDYEQNPIEFHWIESGVFTVKATIGDEDDEWVARYAVSAPSGVTLTAATGTVGVRSIAQIAIEIDGDVRPVATPHLAFGDAEGRRPGILLTAHATGTTRAGEVAFLELASLHRIRLTTAGAVHVFSSHGDWYLNVSEEEEDNDVIDPSALPVSSAVVVQDDNSPASPLMRRDPESGGTLTTYQVDESYRTYLCFKSSRVGSIWVALKRLDWSWSGKASYSTASSQWTLDSGAPAAGAAADAQELPTWRKTTNAVEWTAATQTATTDQANCYGYALGINLFLTPGANKGAAVHEIGTWSAGEVDYAEDRKAELIAACLADGLARAGPGRRIGLYVHVYAEHIDFHFVRDDGDTTWSHKPGIGAVEAGVADHTTIRIDEVTGSHFCDYLYVPPTFLWRMEDEEEHHAPGR